MIILIVPMLSHQTLNCDSNYVIIREAVNAIWKEDPNVSFLLPWPTNPEWRYYHDGFFDDKRIQRLPMRFAEAKKYNNIAFDPTFYLRTFERFVPDLIWNMDVEIGHLLARFSQNYAKNGEPSILNHHHFILHKSTGANMWTYEHFVYLQIISSLLVDWNVFPSRHGLSMLIDNVQEYDVYPLLDRISSKSSILPTAMIDVDLFRRIQKEEERYERPTIFYNHRLAGYKRYMAAFRLLHEIHGERGGDFDVQISYQDGDKSNVIRRKFPFVRIVRNDTREDYLREMARCHVNVTNSSYEVLPVAVIESIGMGHVVIAPRSICFPELMGEDYPFLYRNRKEEKRMINDVLDDPSEISKWGERNRERAFDRFSTERFAKDLLKTFQAVYELRPDPVRSLKERNLRILKSILSGKAVVRRKDWKDFVKKAVLSTSQSLPPSRWGRLMRSLGYESFFNRDEAYWMKGGSS